jgi:hypothetical protein
MATIQNPVFNAVIGEQVRPMAEAARNLLIQAQAAAPGLSGMAAALAQADDADILDDGRTAEGVPPITVGDFRACVGVLGDIVAQVNADPRLASILGACVRPARVVSG